MLFSLTAILCTRDNQFSPDELRTRDESGGKLYFPDLDALAATVPQSDDI